MDYMYIANSFIPGFLWNFADYVQTYTTHWSLPLFKVSTYSTYVVLGLHATVRPTFQKWYANQFAKIWTFMRQNGQGSHKSALCEGHRALCEGLQALCDHLRRIHDEFVTLFACYRKLLRNQMLNHMQLIS